MSRSTLTSALAWLLLVLIVNTVGATSGLMDRARLGLEIALWKPFVWEYSSGIAVLVLIPLVLRLDSQLPFRDNAWKIPAILHLLATIPFSIAHVAIMVALRKAVYASVGEQYDFGHIPTEFLYEYQKDVITYFTVLAGIYGWRLFRSRQSGASYQQAERGTADLQFLIKDRGQTHRVKAADIDWIEAAGNYVLL
ncbi:MAG: hypothetical protein RIA65_08665, partial [Woeseia sp.]